MGFKDKNIVQIPFRLHINDKALFLKLLDDAHLSFQGFSTACMEAYLRGDPAILKVIKDWKTLSSVPKEHLKKYTLSHRERNDIQEELDKMNDTLGDADPRSDT